MLPAKRPVCLVENLPRFSNLVNLYIPNPAKRIYNRNQISPKRISKCKKIRPKKVVLGNTEIKQNLLYYSRQARDVDPEPKRTQRRSRFFWCFLCTIRAAEKSFFTLRGVSAFYRGCLPFTAPIYQTRDCFFTLSHLQSRDCFA